MGSPDQLGTHEGAGTHFPAEQGPGHDVVLPKTPLDRKQTEKLKHGTTY